MDEKPALNMEDPLSLFHPVVSDWFRRTYGTPTDIQTQAWPAVARNEHVLITAPTGSGKTLTAFLWALDSLITGRWESGTTRVLYVSPLKALNTDIRRNLLSPLSGLQTAFREKNLAFPDINVLTRSGDTPQNERRRMTNHPPEILITTPESLNLILSSKNARHMLDGVRAVILDEIHSIAAGKRGTFLMTAVERITLLAGEFQRIAVSATVRPLSVVADFAGGFTADPGELNDRAGSRDGIGPAGAVGMSDRSGGIDAEEGGFRSGGAPNGYRKRGFTILRSTANKIYDISIRLPPEGLHSSEEGSVWPLFARDFKTIIRRNRSSLFFTNTRRYAEKLTLLINQDEEREIAWSHHGSLSKEIRKVVEDRLKNGELQAIVATSSLELGIDIGELDEVVLVETPPTVASALQRIGRAGHGVGRTSRGTIYPLHGRDLIDSAVMIRLIREGEIEETRPVEAPLDILAQTIVAMTGTDEWNADRLYGFFRTVYPFRNLSRKLFDLVLEMLAGRYADSRIRELRPRISYDRMDGSIRAVDGALALIYSSGGTIPDRGSYTLRIQGSGAKVGELDEEFVWERHVGDTFPLGAQHWKIMKIDQQNVEVAPWNGTGGIIPFWRAENRYRDFSYMDRLSVFLETWNDRLESPEFEEELEARSRMNGPAARETIDFLVTQRKVTGKSLPHRHHILIERHRGMLSEADTDQYLIHTLWGGKVNFPLSLILSVFWERRYGTEPEMYTDNNAVIFVVPKDIGEPDPALLLAQAAEEISAGGERRAEEILRKKLESTGFFGAKFRENAGRALLLPRGGMGKRTPLWITRLRSKKLLDQVMKYDDFPILLETWRSCLHDELDIPALVNLLGETHRGEITVSRAETIVPSPFSRHLMWTTTEAHLYDGDRPLSNGGSSLSGDILRDAVFTPHLRPRIDRATVTAFEAKLKRIAPGYGPETPRETVDWVKERLLIPADEWETLLEALRADQPGLFDAGSGIVTRHEESSSGGTGPAEPAPSGFMEDLSARLLRLNLPGAGIPSVVALEKLPAIASGFRIPRELLSGCIGPLIPEHAVDGGPTAACPLPGMLPVAVEDAFRLAGRTEDWEQPDTAGTAETGRFYVPEAFLLEWLRFSGPITVERIAAVTGLSAGNLLSSFETLAENEQTVLDFLTDDAEELQVCDPENLESLLRISRSRRRQGFTALGPEYLQLFLARRQGIVRESPHRDDDLRSVLEILFGYPAAAELWEREIFPARLNPYYPAWLDSLFRESDLVWFGAQKGRIGFCFYEDYELFGEPDAENREDADSGGEKSPYAFLRGKSEVRELLAGTGLSFSDLQTALWNEAWNGRITSEGFDAVRRGAAGGFGSGERRVRDGGSSGGYRAPGSAGIAGSGSGTDAERRPAETGSARNPDLSAASRYRARLRREGGWSPVRMPEERWLRLPAVRSDYDAVDAEELVRDRVRQLLLRYGVVFRQLLENELPCLRWSAVQRSLRLMELSGEVVSGRFFEGVPGLQFASWQALRDLRLLKERTDEPVYFLNAQDPASLCALGLENLPWKLPPRLSSTHLVFRGTSLVLVSKRDARDLEFLVPPDDPRIREYLGFLNVLAGRKTSPVVVGIETVNGEPVRNSPYAGVLVEAGLSRDYRAFRLRGHIKTSGNP